VPVLLVLCAVLLPACGGEDAGQVVKAAPREASAGEAAAVRVIRRWSDAIRVREGKIAEWYRLPDDSAAPDPAQPDAPQEPVGPIV
jgi:hypothetical protein